MSAYSEKLKDPRWQKKRLEILDRDHWACQSCFDAGSTLHVHHRSYVWGNDPWDYDNKLLVTLCESCHAEETDNLKLEERALLNTLKMGGADSLELNDMMDSLADIRRSQLSDPEWTMFTWHLRRVFAGRESNTGLWKQINDAYWEMLKDRAERNGKQD